MEIRVKYIGYFCTWWVTCRIFWTKTRFHVSDFVEHFWHVNCFDKNETKILNCPWIWWNYIICILSFRVVFISECLKIQFRFHKLWTRNIDTWAWIYFSWWTFFRNFCFWTIIHFGKSLLNKLKTKVFEESVGLYESFQDFDFQNEAFVLYVAGIFQNKRAQKYIMDKVV